MVDLKRIKGEFNVDLVERTENKSEHLAVDFDDYSKVCNINNDGSRLRGILSTESYSEIVNDPSTLFIESSGRSMPVLADIKYGLAMGYDVDRCLEYSDGLSSDVKMLTLPIHELNESELSQLADVIDKCSNFALYFSDHNGDEAGKLKTILDSLNLAQEERLLVDSRAKKEDEQAALYLYSYKAKQDVKRSPKKLSLRDVQDYYDRNIGPYVSSDGSHVTKLSMGEALSDIQADEMWDLYNDMFEFLGEGHPISMQDTKEDFFALLRSSNTMISATYDSSNNKLDCFTYFIDDMSKMYWLNQSYLENVSADSSDDCDYMTDLFTPGLVSGGMGTSYSVTPVCLLAKSGDEAGLSANMMFENTNLSKRVVPWVVDKAMKQSCNYAKLTPSTIIDKVSYNLWLIHDKV